MTLNEIRQKYPYYKNTPDEQLADAIYKKDYSHAPREEFNKRIGYEPESKAMQGIKNIGHDWAHFGKNLAIGALEGGRGLANTPHNLANMIGYGDKVPNFADPEFNYAEALGEKEEPTLSDKLVRGFAQYAPSLALPGANLGKAGSALGSIPKAGKFIQGAVEQAIPQAAYGATQNENPLEGALEGGVGSVAGSSVGAALSKGINALRPSKMFRGELSPQQLEHNLEVTKGTETGLGRVIKSPTLMRLQENILPHIIGSGGYKTMAGNAAKIQEKGASFLNKMSGNLNPLNWGEKIKEALTNSARDVERVKGEKFKRVNRLAEEANVSTDRSHLRAAAQATLKQIESDADLAKFTNPADIKLLKDIANGESRAVQSSSARIPNNNSDSVSVITGKKIPTTHNYSLENTDILRGKIGQMAHEAFTKGEQPKGMIYKSLKTALEKDVDKAIESSSSEELKKAHKNAMEYYKNEYAPYKDKDIQKFIKQGGDPDLILSHFIKGGKNDRATLLQKLSKAVRQQPNGTDNILASSYLSRAMDKEGNLNPLKLKSLYHDLGENQANALFGTGKMHKTIKDYVDLVGKNTEGFNLMFNANNGQRNIDLLAKLGQMSASLAQGHGVVSFLAPLVALGASSKIVNKVLSNPGYREKLIKAMIKDKTFEVPKAATSKIGSVSAQQKEKQKPLELTLTKALGNK